MRPIQAVFLPFGEDPCTHTTSGVYPLQGDDSMSEQHEQPMIAHVLFTDIVGFSKLHSDEAVKVVQTLQAIIKRTEQVRRAQESGDLICLPTGDGMALVFFGSPIAPVECAVAISRELQQVDLKLRMGLHTGPVYNVSDINEARNVAGAGINLAERVMSCGDAGHILVSKSMADVVKELSAWSALLHDLGEAEVKHGQKIQVYNLIGPDFGNAEIPSKLQAAIPTITPERATSGILAPNSLPNVLKHYRLGSKLGEGGMGAVYRALDMRLERPVALKVLNSYTMLDPARKERFLLEAKTASALNHPNIVTVYDIDSDAGVDFIVMESVEGKTLADLIGHGPLAIEEALQYGVQIAEALAKAHASGIVHRDIKPTNIMITDGGLVKILDFGLAKLVERDDLHLTQKGLLIGTVAYMSPEQAAGSPVDTRSDVFSFGAVLYEMLTGQRAFALGQVAALDFKGIPVSLEKIISRCLERDPGARFQQMEEVRRALQEIRDTSPAQQAVASPSASQLSARKLGVWQLAALGITLAAVTGGIVWYQSNSKAKLQTEVKQERKAAPTTPAGEQQSQRPAQQQVETTQAPPPGRQTTKAAGKVSAPSERAKPTLTLAGWEAAGGWTREDSVLVHRGGDFVLAPISPQPGLFVFTVRLRKGKRLEWIVNYMDDKNYFLFQVDKKNLKRISVTAGKSTKLVEVLHNLDWNADISIQLRVTPQLIEHRILRDRSWFVIDSWHSSGQPFKIGRFGFHIPGNDQIALSDFSFKP